MRAVLLLVEEAFFQTAKMMQNIEENALGRKFELNESQYMQGENLVFQKLKTKLVLQPCTASLAVHINALKESLI